MRKTYKVGTVGIDSIIGKRIYPRETVEAAIKKAQKSIDKKTFFVSRRSAEYSGVELLDIIGIVRGLFIRQNSVYADIQFLDTPANEEFQKILLQLPWIDESKLFTTVALGGVQQSWNDEEPDTVMDDYELIGICAALQSHE